MKNIATSVLYVLSIAVAIGIGMTQVGNETFIGGGGTHHAFIEKCTKKVAAQDPCESEWVKYEPIGGFSKLKGDDSQTTWCESSNCVDFKKPTFIYDSD